MHVPPADFILALRASMESYDFTRDSGANIRHNAPWMLENRCPFAALSLPEDAVS
jgi:hypothetical protein